MRSIIGINRLIPGSNVVWYFPKRSITHALCYGTIAMPKLVLVCLPFDCHLRAVLMLATTAGRGLLAILLRLYPSLLAELAARIRKIKCA